MLLIERSFSTVECSWIMTIVKSTAIFAAFAGGILGDRIGARAVILLSFALTGFAMLALPFSKTVWLVGGFGVLTIFAQGLFAAPLRILLIKSVGNAHRKEALAWLRTGQNAAVLCANGIAYAISNFGLLPIFIFDAVTSFVAFFLGKRLLPDLRTNVSAVPINEVEDSYKTNLTDFFLIVMLNAGFNILLELFFVSSAAQAKLAFGVRGVEVFSQVMMINTFLCATLNVWSARLFKSVAFSCILGVLAQYFAWVIMASSANNMASYFGSVFLQTIGELSFTALTSFLILKIIPDRGNQGKIYGVALVFQLGGRAIGAALAFPLLDHANWGVVGGGVLSVMLVVIALIIDRRLKV